MTGTELVLPNGDVVPVRDHRASRLLDGGEVRDPRGATRLVGYSSPTLPQVPEWEAAAAFRSGYLANVIAYRCISLRARAGASVPIVAGRRYGDESTIDADAPLARLLGPPPGGPAPKMSARRLVRWTLAQKIVTGRYAWEIESGDAGRPTALWPLAAVDLKAYPSSSGVEWFRLFEYGRGADPVRFKPEDVFYGWEPSGLDFRQAESELQALRFDLTLINMCDRYGIGFLRNNAVPAAIVTTTKFPNDDARKAFERNWRADFGGPDNAGRVAINELSDDGDGPVGDSIDVKVLGLSAKDGRLIEQRRELMQEVAVGLGTPWSKLDASGRTFDNASQEDLDWWENTILPDLQDLEDQINMQLAPRLGSEVCWFDLRAVRALQRRIVPVTQAVGAPAMVQAQLMTINEARVDYGLDPVDGGDRVMTVEEIQALRGAVGGGDPDLVRAALAGPEQRTPEPPAVEPPEPEQRAVQPAEQRVPDPEQTEVRRALIWRTADAVVRQLEARWERSWRRMFARQADATLTRLKGKRGRQALGYGTDGQLLDERRDGDPAEGIDPAQVFDAAFWTAESEELAADLYEGVTVAGLSRLTASFGTSFDLSARWVAEFIEARSHQLAGLVTQTTYDAIRTELIAGVGLGESIDDLAARIRAVFAAADETRSVTIARTEVISAYNGSAVLGASQLPADVVAGQEWIATRDSRTRRAHAAVDGQVVAIGQPFLVAGSEMGYPGDPSAPARQVVNCRCTVAFLTPDEMAELAERSARRLPLRAAQALLAMVPSGADEFDFITWRRAAEEVAAA